MLWPTEALSDVAKTVTKVTSASPIISAVAVWAVRCGLRMAFARPSFPGTPANAAPGAPRIRASGRAISGASMARPTKTTSTPTPRSVKTCPDARRPERRGRSRRRR